MMDHRIYMDWNATARLVPAARVAMLTVLEEVGNPSSIHYHGRIAREHMEKARRELGAFINTHPQNIIFTASGSEANNLAIANHAGYPILVSAIEHDSVFKPANRHQADHIAVPRKGIVDLSDLEKKLAGLGKPAFVSLMLANNETGVVQPIADAAKIVHRYGGVIHCDAAQALNRLDIDIQALGVDMLTLSSHKAGGPVGAGALALGADRVLSPLILGGGQERSRRAGTENVAAVAGFGACLGKAAFAEMEPLRNLLEEGLLINDSSVTIFGKSEERLPNTSCFAGTAKKADALLMGFDLAGISISAGSACSSGKMKPSRVIEAMGYGKDIAAFSLRVSLGPGNDGKDIEQFLMIWRDLNRLFHQRPDLNPVNLNFRSM